MKPLISEIRRSKGLMQKYVAEQIGVSQQQLSDFERGKTYPRIDRAYNLAKVLGCDVNDLYKEDEE